MWFWIDHGWMITAAGWGFYAGLGLLLLWLFSRIFRTSSAAAFVGYTVCAVPMAVALVLFIAGATP